MGNLYEASNQWATRPEDERFETIEAARAVCAAYRDSAAEGIVPWNSLTVQPAADCANMELVGRNATATLTNYAFGQLAQRVGAPPAYLAGLPLTLAAQCIQTGLAQHTDATECALLLHRNGHLTARALLTTRYERIWDADVFQRLGDLTARGWRVPPARPCRSGQTGSRLATAADVLQQRGTIAAGLAVREGDLIAPAGIYASDRDMFCFMVSDTVVDETRGLCRGFFVSNSEVGAGSFKITTFLYDSVCGNHIIWGAQEVKEVRVVHVGANAKSWRIDLTQLADYAGASATADRRLIEASKTFRIAADKDTLLDALFADRSLNISRATLEAGYTACVDNRDGDPLTAWGIVSGLTRHSQTLAYASARTRLDTAAGRILKRVDF